MEAPDLRKMEWSTTPSPLGNIPTNWLTTIPPTMAKSSYCFAPEHSLGLLAFPQFNDLWIKPTEFTTCKIIKHNTKCQWNLGPPTVFETQYFREPLDTLSHTKRLGCYAWQQSDHLARLTNKNLDAGLTDHVIVGITLTLTYGRVLHVSATSTKPTVVQIRTLVASGSGIIQVHWREQSKSKPTFQSGKPDLCVGVNYYLESYLQCYQTNTKFYIHSPEHSIGIIYSKFLLHK